MAEKVLFKADGKQAIAVVAMVAAIFVFGAGEVLIGGILVAISAVLSIGGIFWDAHQADKRQAAARQGAEPPSVNNQQGKP